MNYTKKAIKGTGTVFFLFILTSISGYLFKLLLSRAITPEQYGLFFSITNLLGLVAVFRLIGLHTTLSKFISEKKNKKEYDKIHGAINFSVILSLFVSIIMFACFFFLSDFLAITYIGDISASIYIKILALTIPIGSIVILSRSVFQAFNNMFIYQLIPLLRNTLYIIFIAISLLFLNSANTFLPVIIYVITETVLLIFYPFGIKKYLKNSKSKISRRTKKYLLRFGMSVLLTGLTTTVISYFDTVLITIFKNLNEVAIYNIALPTGKLLWSFGIAISSTMLPIVSELYKKEKYKKIKYSIWNIYKYTILLLSPLVIIFFIYSKFIIKTLYGLNYVNAAPVLMIVVINSIFVNITNINRTTLTAIGKPITATKIMGSGAIINIILNIIFIPYFGAAGAAFTTLISFIFMAVYSVIKINSNINTNIEISKKQVYAAIKFIISIFCFLFIVEIIKSVIENIWIEGIVIITIAFLVYVFFIIKTNLITKNEIIKIKKRVFA